MKHILAFLSLILFCSAPVASQTISDTLFLHITIPEEDTTITSFSRYRVSGGTHPGARAFINGEEVKVYANGAFAKLIFLEKDTTIVEFKVEMNGESISRDMLYLRPVPTEPIEPGSKTITEEMMLPNDDIWLRSGDVLMVRFKGSSGEKAVFNIDGFKRNIPMREIEGSDGIYVGSYEVLPGDNVSEQHITFKVKKGLFGYVKKKSPHKVSFNRLPRVAETTRDRTHLNIGMGTDRLGGARYGYLEEGVRLKVIGLLRNHYKVQLSSGLSAWVPVSHAQLLPEGTRIPESLTGSIRITGNSKEDIITLNLSDKLPYTSGQELDPNKIIVNVWGATSNTNWKTKHLSSEGIKEVEWRQVKDGQYQLVIELNHKQNWGYSVGYGWGSQLVIKVKRPPVVQDSLKPLTGVTIAIDAGHGGRNNGALGSTGLTEKQVNLEMSEKLDSLLQERGAKTVMTRTDDSYVLMHDRADMVLDNNSDLLVSIHANSLGYTSDPFEIRGTGMFYKHVAFKPLAEKMYEKFLELGLAEYGVTGSFNFTLNAPIELPNVLVEAAFMSHPEEEILLSDPDFQTRIAEQIVTSLEEYFLEYADTSSLK